MRRKPKSVGKKAHRPKVKLRFPDLDQAKGAVLSSLRSPESQRGYGHSIDEFIAWYCSEPRLSFNKTVVTRYRIHLETRQLAPGIVNIRFRVLYVFIVLAHDRRRLLHFNVTAHPTSEWTAQQLVEAFPWDGPPRYLLHDRDSIYRGSFPPRVRRMGIREIRTAPRSPGQNPYVERLVGSIRRECLDHVVVLNESSLRALLNSYFAYYLPSRTHLALVKDSPEARAIQGPELGAVVGIPEVGGLHHRYERRAA